MYRQHGFQDKDLLLETLVKDDSMTFFPEFNLLVVSSSYDPSEGPYNRTTAIFNARTSEIASGEFFKGCNYVSDMVFERGQDKAFAVIDSFDRDADGSCWIDPRMSMLAGLFSWSLTIDAGSISGLVDSASYYQKHLMSDREGFELSHGRPLPDMSARPLGAGARELLDNLTSSETVSYFPEFNLLVTTTDFVPSGLHDRETAIFNVFPSELAYGKLFQGFENVADIPYSGPLSTLSPCFRLLAKMSMGSVLPISPCAPLPRFSAVPTLSARSPCPNFLTSWPSASVSSLRSIPISPTERRRKSTPSRMYQISRSKSIVKTMTTSLPVL